MTQLAAVIGLTITVLSVFFNPIQGAQVALIGIAFILVAATGELIRMRTALQYLRASDEHRRKAAAADKRRMKAAGLK